MNCLCKEIKDYTCSYHEAKNKFNSYSIENKARIKIIHSIVSKKERTQADTIKYWSITQLLEREKVYYIDSSLFLESKENL